jgi:hypothetical protein
MDIETFICKEVFVGTEIFFMVGFVAFFGWSICKYFRLEKDGNPEGDFHKLAEHHKRCSHLWFSIAITILFGGAAYAFFHVMEPTCGEKAWQEHPLAEERGGKKDRTATSLEYAIQNTGLAPSGIAVTASDGQPSSLPSSQVPNGRTDRISPDPKPEDDRARNKSASEWSSLTAKIISNFFLYSLFFASWTWALRNFKAHWHNFVINQRRQASLDAIEKLRKSVRDSKLSKADEYRLLDSLFQQSSLLVLMPSESAYMENEAEKEVTSTERLLKTEEILREFLIYGKSNPSRPAAHP